MEEQTPMREAARGALKEVADKATERAGAAAGTVAQEGRVLANALRAAADQVEREGGRMVHGPLRSVAAMFERWADQAQRGGPQQWFSSFDEIGRREPMAVFGIAAMAGFIGTRALRAGARARTSSMQGSQQAEGGTEMTMSFEQQPASPPPHEATWEIDR